MEERERQQTPAAEPSNTGEPLNAGEPEAHGTSEADQGGRVIIPNRTPEQSDAE